MSSAPKKFRRLVTAKFLIFFIPVFLLFNLFTLYSIAERYISKSQDEMAARIGSQLGRVTSLIDGTLIAHQPQMVSRLTSTLLSDPAITCVDVLQNNTPITSLAQPKSLGCKVMQPEKTISSASASTSGLELRVGFSMAEIRGLRSDAAWLAINTAIFGTVAAIFFGYVAFRSSVGKPIRQLITVMGQACNEPETRAKVTSGDEIGELCQAFNCMQDRIAAESAKTRTTLENLSNVYNNTPALLFTMDKDGEIASASEYWLEVTGYTLDEVVGCPLEAILCPQSRARFKSSILLDLQNGLQIHDVPLNLWYKDGSEIDVQLSIAPDRRSNRAGDSFICVMSDVSLLRRAEENLYNLAVTDQLTGLPNRRSVTEYFDKMKSGSDAENKGCTVLFIDLDNFKTVNDTYGHLAGDEILRTSAERIKKIAGEAGFVARLGGDEFSVILVNQSDVKPAEKMAGLLIEELCKPVKFETATCYVGASIGIAHSANFPDDVAETLRLSDQAMYVAKNGGKNRYCVYEESRTAEIQTRAEQIQLIQNGISENWFDIHLQPIMNMETMQPYAFEALLRVSSKYSTVTCIENLIRVAEETGHMEKLGIWIFKQSLSVFGSVIAEYPDKSVSLTVNLSPKQLTETFVRTVKQHMLKHPEMAKRLIFEITETAALDRFDAVCVLLQDLRNIGIRIALDDFGTGYSSLSYISRLPIDIVKLDKSFVLHQNPADDTQEINQSRKILLRSLATLAADLGLEIVAEGLESVDVMEDYRALGVKLGQGYLFSRPLPQSDLPSWLIADRGNFKTDWQAEKISA